MDETSVPPLRRRRWPVVVALAIVAMVALAAGTLAWLASASALERLLAELAARSGGTLAFEGAEGSLLSEVRVRRITYRDGHVDAVVESATLTWSPLALLRRELRIEGLGAQRVAVKLAPSDEPAAMPQTLALAIDVSVRHAGVARLEFASGTAVHVLEGVELAYAGGRSQHRISGARLVSEWGSLGGDATLAAQAPFAVRGAFTLQGAGPLAGASASATLAGTLAAVDATLDARFADATAHGTARIAPAAKRPLVAATIEARDVDLARIDAAWPQTRIAATVDATADGDRYVGNLHAGNAAPGALDAGRVPLAALDARYALTRERLELDDLVADFGPGGRASGSGRLDLASASTLPPSEWNVTVRALDLARLSRRAIATRLDGTLRARIERGEQRIEADLRERDRALALVATVRGDSVDVERFRARAGGGEAAGRAKLMLAGERHFEVAATAKRFDPSHFFDAPPASLDGAVDAKGRLAAPWSAEGRVTLQPTSRVAGLAASGTASGRMSAGAIEAATIDVNIADATLHASGSYGSPDSALAFAVDAPHLATLAPVAPSRWPEGLAGAIRGRGAITGDPRSPGGHVEASARALALGGYTAGALDVRASIGAARVIRERPIAIEAAARDVGTPHGRYDKASFAFDGTLARHVATVALAGEGLDASARLEGAFAASSTLGAPSWSGTLASFDNRGAYAMRLVSPARLAWARDSVDLGGATLAIADGVFRVDALTWSDGRVDTRGAFTGVPAQAIAQLARVELPLRSTLVLGGEWNVSAAPRLAGTARVRRERGDLFAGTGVLASGEMAFGLETFDLAATIADGTLEANASMRAAVLGTARASARVGGVVRAGPVPPDAPVDAKLEASLATLVPLQPLLGTSAIVDGSVVAQATAKGAWGNLAVSGSLVASGVRIAAPQYGVHWTNGRLRARLAADALTLDELAFDAGDGTFTAHGTLASFHAATAASGPSAAVTWRAQRFRALNRPDMRIVVDGEGTLGAAQRRILLQGRLTAREGHFEIARSTENRLGPDVVVAGARREPPPDRFGDVPLALDLDLDLGERLDILGRGFDARLAGRVHLATSAARELVARGTITTVSGTYTAFGQRLTIERGRLIFDGPVANPALDIVAVRKNLAVEAGVAVTGSVDVPHVVLVSNPPVPDGEKLSWLVLGQGLERTSGADAAALQAAAAALFGQDSAPLGTTIARRFGLDDISVRSATTATATSAGALGGQVVAFGKRLSDKLYIVYEQGLSVANNALRLEYALTRNLTLRGEAGAVSGVGIYFQRSFD